MNIFLTLSPISVILSAKESHFFSPPENVYFIWVTYKIIFPKGLLRDLFRKRLADINALSVLFPPPPESFSLTYMFPGSERKWLSFAFKITENRDNGKKLFKKISNPG